MGCCVLERETAVIRAVQSVLKVDGKDRTPVWLFS